MRHLFAVGVLLGALSLAGRAGADGTLQAVVRIVSEEDRALYERIVGQVADLDVRIEAADAPAIEAKVVDQLSAADALAAARRARVVMWFEAGVDALGKRRLLVFVSEPESGRVLVRRIGQDETSARPSSATMEAAALVVRGALRALSSGGTIGVERRLVLEPEPSPSTVPPGRLPPPSAPTPASPQTRAAEGPPPKTALVLFGALGVQLASDGEPAINEALALFAGVRARRWELRLDAALGLPTESSDAYATLRLWRESLALALSYTFVRSPRWALAAGLRAGGLAFERSTHDASPSVALSSPSWTLVPIVGPELAVRWQPTESPNWGLILVGGADAVLGEPDIGFVVAGRFQSAVRPWVIQPRAVLGFEVATF